MDATDAPLSDAEPADAQPLDAQPVDAPGFDAADTKDAKVAKDAGQTCDPSPAGKPCPGELFCAPAKEKCVAVTCKLPSQWAAVQKVSKLSIASTSTDWCDLDGNGVPDNSFAKIATLYKDFDKSLNSLLKDGSIVVLLDALGYSASGTPFEIRFLHGDVAAENPKCDLQAIDGNCAYTVRRSNFLLSAPSGDCPPLALFPNSTVVAGTLHAKAKGKQVLTIPANGAGLVGNVVLHRMQVTGQVGTGATWQATQSGRLCMAIEIDTGAPASGTVNCEGDPKGVKDCQSAAFDFETVPGHVIGLTLN